MLHYVTLCYMLHHVTSCYYQHGGLGRKEVALVLPWLNRFWGDTAKVKYGQVAFRRWIFSPDFASRASPQSASGAELWVKLGPNGSMVFEWSNAKNGPKWYHMILGSLPQFWPPVWHSVTLKAILGTGQRAPSLRSPFGSSLPPLQPWRRVFKLSCNVSLPMFWVEVIASVFSSFIIFILNWLCALGFARVQHMLRQSKETNRHNSLDEVLRAAYARTSRYSSRTDCAVLRHIFRRMRVGQVGTWG